MDLGGQREEVGSRRSEVRGPQLNSLRSSSLKNLTGQAGIRENKKRKVMIDILMNLLSGKREEPDIKIYNLQGWKI